MGIENTPEYKQSKKMRPACNRVLQEVFGVDKNQIIRYSKNGQPHILDREFAIDLKVVLDNGVQLSGQEKALSHRFYKRFRTFTIEFYQNRYTKEPGDWFKIASQFYLHGYGNETNTEFIEWYIFKLFDLMIWLQDASINDLELYLKPAGGSRASFLPIPYDKIPKHVIFAKGNQSGDIKIYDDLEVLI